MSHLAHSVRPWHRLVLVLLISPLATCADGLDIAPSRPATTNLAPADGWVLHAPRDPYVVPIAKTYVLTNQGSKSLHYELVATAPWVLVLDPAKGSVPVGESTSFTISLDLPPIEGLPPGADRRSP